MEVEAGLAESTCAASPSSFLRTKRWNLESAFTSTSLKSAESSGPGDSLLQALGREGSRAVSQRTNSPRPLPTSWPAAWPGEGASWGSSWGGPVKALLGPSFSLGPPSTPPGRQGLSVQPWPVRS